ncbi:MAG: DeoR/GlpR transcriptional regulator [Rhodococcus sp. (in: high G+C Gram-positive bacteria)]|nr:MAG: DeoR/GlpR transcriptional regulator [Rhodococcus sp. (in: high G+C Gram-positive bacteria)]
MMLARQRQQVILDEVTAHGAVKVVDLGATLGVSDMTIRRDINELVEQGLVERVHGGVTLPRSASVHEPGFSAKSELDREAKRAIARAAARLVRPGTSVGISGGTTTHALARELLDVPDITVVTNSLPVADAFHDGGRDDQTILLTVVLADHTKWGVTALANTIPLSDVDILITDAGLERAAQEALADHVGDLVVTRENREGLIDDRA